MLARCARCQNTFTTDRFGLQRCPHCGSELMLTDPNAAVTALPGGSAPPAPRSEAPRGPTPAASSEGGTSLPPPPGGWPPPPGGGGFGPPPGPPPGGELPAPFAERDRLGWMTAFFETWKLAATKPQEFFARVRVDQTGSAVLFGIIAATLGNTVSALYGWLAGQQSLMAMREAMERVPPEQREMIERLLPYLAGAGTLWQILFAPVFAVISIYLGTAIVHLLLMLFRGATRGFDATLTVVAYAHGLYLLLAVPGCGGLVSAVWMIVVLVIGIAAAHRCGQGKAAAAVLMPLVLVCCCCGGSAGLAGLSVIRAIGGASSGDPVDL